MLRSRSRQKMKKPVVATLVIMLGMALPAFAFADAVAGDVWLGW